MVHNIKNEQLPYLTCNYHHSAFVDFPLCKNSSFIKNQTQICARLPHKLPTFTWRRKKNSLINLALFFLGKYCHMFLCVHCLKENVACTQNGQCCKGQCTYGRCKKDAAPGAPGTFCDRHDDCKDPPGTCCVRFVQKMYKIFSLLRDMGTNKSEINNLTARLRGARGFVG